MQDVHGGAYFRRSLRSQARSCGPADGTRLGGAAGSRRVRRARPTKSVEHGHRVGVLVDAVTRVEVAPVRLTRGARLTTGAVAARNACRCRAAGPAATAGTTVTAPTAVTAAAAHARVAVWRGFFPFMNKRLGVAATATAAVAATSATRTVAAHAAFVAGAASPAVTRLPAARTTGTAGTTGPAGKGVCTCAAPGAGTAIPIGATLAAESLTRKPGKGFRPSADGEAAAAVATPTTLGAEATGSGVAAVASLRCAKPGIASTVAAVAPPPQKKCPQRCHRRLLGQRRCRRNRRPLRPPL